MISLQMVLVAHFIKFLVLEQSITPILAGKVFSVMFFSGMVGRVILAATSDLFYKGIGVPLIYNCLYFYFLHSNISNEHTYNNECIVWRKCIVRFFSIGWFSLL